MSDKWGEALEFDGCVIQTLITRVREYQLKNTEINVILPCFRLIEPGYGFAVGYSCGENLLEL